jgi:hypothetical protein
MDRRLSILVLAGVLIPSLTNAEERTPSATSAAKAALTGCEANFSAFRKYKCRFTTKYAKAVDRAAAQRGDLYDVQACEFIIVVDGDQKKVQCLADTEVKKAELKPRGKGQFSVARTFIPYALLHDRESCLEYSAYMQTAFMLRPGKNPPYQDPMPLDLFGALQPWIVAAPPKMIERLEHGLARLTAAGEGMLGERPIIRMEMQDQLFNFNIAFDVTRGLLPVQIVKWRVLPNGSKDEATYSLADAREYTGHKWFPTHVSYLAECGPGPVGVRDFAVTDLAVDAPLSDEDLGVHVPAGTTVEWKKPRDREFFRLRQNELMKPSDVNRVEKMLGQSAKTPRMDTTIKTESGGWLRHVSRVSPTWAALTAGLVLLGVGFWWRRRMIRLGEG